MIDIQRAKENLSRREGARRLSNFARWQQAKADFDRIVSMVVERYRPTRLIQWGSLLDPNAFDEHSDIDLATEGILDAQEFFSLIGDVMMMTSIKVDIVQMEKIEPEFAEIIRNKGVVVYDEKLANA